MFTYSIYGALDSINSTSIILLSIKREFQALLFHSVSTIIRNNCQLFGKLLCTAFVKSATNKLYEKSLRTVMQMS